MKKALVKIETPPATPEDQRDSGFVAAMKYQNDKDAVLEAQIRDARYNPLNGHMHSRHPYLEQQLDAKLRNTSTGNFIEQNGFLLFAALIIVMFMYAGGDVWKFISILLRLHH